MNVELRTNTHLVIGNSLFDILLLSLESRYVSKLIRKASGLNCLGGLSVNNIAIRRIFLK